MPLGRVEYPSAFALQWGRPPAAIAVIPIRFPEFTVERVTYVLKKAAHGAPQTDRPGCYAPTLARLSHAMYANELRDEQVAAEVLAQVGAYSRLSKTNAAQTLLRQWHSLCSWRHHGSK